MIQENSKEVVSVTIEAAKLTSELLKAVLREHFENKPKTTGRTSLNKLSGGKADKLKSIEITANNIADFEKVAAKYDMKYMVKKDPTAEKPTYHVLFQGNSLQQVNKALQEYSFDKEQQVTRFTLEKIKGMSDVSQEKSQDKHRERKKEKKLNRGDLSK